MIKPAYMTLAYGKNVLLDHIHVFKCAEAAEHNRHDICLAYSDNVIYNYTSIEAGGHEQWIG
ncbi:hypothetical protein D3C86_2253790 [compost metagenome]